MAEKREQLVHFVEPQGLFALFQLADKAQAHARFFGKVNLGQPQFLAAFFYESGDCRHFYTFSGVKIVFVFEKIPNGCSFIFLKKTTPVRGGNQFFQKVKPNAAAIFQKAGSPETRRTNSDLIKQNKPPNKDSTACQNALEARSSRSRTLGQNARFWPIFYQIHKKFTKNSAKKPQLPGQTAHSFVLSNGENRLSGGRFLGVWQKQFFEKNAVRTAQKLKF